MAVADGKTPNGSHEEAVMLEQPKLSYECRQQLAEWVRLYCPCATENSEFLRGLRLIVERELTASFRRQIISGNATPPTGTDGGTA